MAKSSAKKTTGRRKPETSTVKVTLVKSPIGFDRTQGLTVQGMGLRRIGHTVELVDTPATRGMILKVRHLVTVQE
jgi:large subunit ribosomal protein L30